MIVLPLLQETQDQQREIALPLRVVQDLHGEFFVVGHGVEDGVGDAFGEQPVHHLVGAVVLDLGHYGVVAADAVGDAVGELELVFIAHLGAEQFVELVDDLGKALLFRIVGLAGADVGDGFEPVVIGALLLEVQALFGALVQAVVGQLQLVDVDLLLFQVLDAQQRMQGAGVDVELFQLVVLEVDDL